MLDEKLMAKMRATEIEARSYVWSFERTVQYMMDLFMVDRETVNQYFTERKPL